MLKQLLIPILATLQMIAVGAIREQDKDNKQSLVRFMGVELRARPYEGKEGVSHLSNGIPS